MHPSLSRRDFLKLVAVGLGATACQWLSIPPQLTGPSPSATPRPFVPTGTLGSPTGAPAGYPGPFATPSTAPPASPTATPGATASTATPADLPFPTWIVDGHQDIAWNALEFGRDPRQSAGEVRRQEANTDIPDLIGERTTGLPEYLAGRVGLIFATLFVLPSQAAYPGYNAMTYASPGQAQKRAQAQLDFYQHLAGPGERFRLVTSPAELQAVVKSWTQPVPGQEPLVGLVLVMEGADPLINPEDVVQWHQAGLRILGPAWHATRYSAGTGAPGPLTDLGRRLLEAMAPLKMVLDLSHLSEAAYLEAVDSYPAQMIASHSNPHAFLPTDRGLSNQMIQKLIARDGVIGVNLYDRFLLPGWKPGPGARQAVTLDKVGEVIDTIVQLAGDTRHVAIGSDLDGGFGRAEIPFEMDTCADLLKLGPVLEKRGYSHEDIEAILNGNWLRVVARCLESG